MRSKSDITEKWKQETKKYASEKELLGIMASVLRDYVADEGIDFQSRSGAHKGTIDWSNHVARHLKEINSLSWQSINAFFSNPKPL